MSFFWEVAIPDVINRMGHVVIREFGDSLHLKTPSCNVREELLQVGEQQTWLWDEHIGCRCNLHYGDLRCRVYDQAAKRCCWFPYQRYTSANINKWPASLLYVDMCSAWFSLFLLVVKYFTWLLVHSLLFLSPGLIYNSTTWLDL